ncbi:MAG: TraB/VirB10 family protein [Pseudomonadota bacterium]
MSEENLKRRRAQRLVLGGASALAVTAAGFWVFSGEGSDNQSRAEDLRRRRAMTDVINPPGLGDDFLSETGTRLASVEESVGTLEEQVRRLSAILTEKDRELAGTRAELDKTRNDALAMVEDLAARVAGEPSSSSSPNAALPSPQSPRPAGGDPFVQRGVVPIGPQVPGAAPLPIAPAVPRTVEIMTFASAEDALDTKVLRPAIYDADDGDYVPPNAYARANVIVGVDMSTGVRLSADPKPVLLRITGPAFSVLQDGQRLDTDLTGCLVNGAAHAELASERVYVQLQKITCDRGGGEIAESQVEGYVAQLGKVGIRGRVVSREGDIVEKALVAGIIGGFGRGISRNTDLALGAGGAIGSGGTTVLTNRELSTGEIAAGGLGEGLSTAADTVSDYLIDRAEQYQPVIEMPTGVDVEIVFLSGFFARGER